MRPRIISLLLSLGGAGIALGAACGDGQGVVRGDASSTGGSGGAGGAGGAGAMGGCSPIYRPCWYCGDGRLDPREECDDGNEVGGDGCSALCQIEHGHACTVSWCMTSSFCGDGIVTDGEACDDGNRTPGGASGIGCRIDCQAIEPGWYCPFSGQPCKPLGTPSASIDAGICGDADAPCLSTCGNGTLDDGEECDLGTTGNDGIYGRCSPQCKLAAHCGDGLLNGPEECDLAELNVAAEGDEDGCTPACFAPRFPSRYCGDGILDADLGEACDLGASNGAPGQRCTLDCTVIGTRWSECTVMCL